MFKKGGYVEDKDQIIQRLKEEKEMILRDLKAAEKDKKIAALEKEIAEKGEYFIKHVVKDDERQYRLLRRVVSNNFYGRPMIVIEDMGSWDSFDSASAAYEHMHKEDISLGEKDD